MISSDLGYLGKKQSAKERDGDLDRYVIYI